MNRLCAFLLVSCFILGLLSLIGKHMFVPDHSQLIFPAITDQSDWKEFHKKQHRTLELWLENNCVTEIMKPTAWGADTNEDDKGDSREKRSIPNWSGSASDFFAWVEQLRSHAGYAKMDELARTFWAHFPSASRLGYEVPEPEE